MNRFFTFLILTILSTGSESFAACCGYDQREPSVCPNISCEWERSGERCNSNEECCPGRECDAFGFCQMCR